MTTLAAPVPAAGRAVAKTRERQPRRWPVENTCIFILTMVVYLAAADYLVIHLHFTTGDAYARVANADYVIATRDPHLGAIGFIWPPLPSFLDIPILALQRWFPFLASQAFAGSVEAALFGAGTVVMISIALRRVGVVMPIRWLLLIAWVTNPMTAFYSTEGMSEGPFVFFAMASLLAFMRWAERRRAGDLALLGIVVGLGTLVRDEMVVLALFVGAGVIFCSIGRKVCWRQLETNALLYGLPVAFILSLWIGSMAIIEHDPLYFAHSGYSNAAIAAAGGVSGNAQLVALKAWSAAVALVGGQSIRLFPVVLVLMAAVALRAILFRNRRPALVLLALSLPLPLVDIYLLHLNQFNPSLRYQIFVIPYATGLAVYLLAELRKVRPRLVSFAALPLIAAMFISNLSAFQIMAQPRAFGDEWLAIKAVESNVSAGTFGPSSDAYDQGAQLSRAVALANKDNGLIAMDDFLGFNIFMTAPDQSRYVVTSDENFEAVLGQPLVYHVEYFLVPQPGGQGGLDHINASYPSLWATGAGFASLVANIGGPEGWRLYKITGNSGRG